MKPSTLATPFADLPEDDLAVLAGQPGGQTAFKALAQRFHARIIRVCRRFSRRYGLFADDAREARQQGFVFLREIAVDFARLTAAAKHVGTFAAFLHVRLPGRLLHWLRARLSKRQCWQLVSSPATLERLATTVGRNSPCPSSLKDRDGDPAVLAEHKEQDDRLHQEIDQLAPPTRRLLGAWLAGVSLKKLARRWRRSLRALQIRLRNCQTMLKVRLRTWRD
jgi:DNA-directed RNA polymerase specialized sigma24 family protein